MNITPPRRKHLPASIWLFVLGCIAICIYALMSMREAAAIYDGALGMQAQAGPGTVAKVSFPESEKPLNIPDWSLLRPGNIWSLTSRDSPLPEGFKTPKLINTSVAHGDSDQPMRVQARIEQPLKRLFDAAEQDGIELMLSSAYRSIEDQTKLYREFVAEQGQEMANLYVARPGTSEHHTGLSIDFATASGPCESNSDKCSLAVDAADWLLENGPTHGFIQRYPEGKQPLTGVAFEPWHYRYVGVPMARAVAESGLTYDEAVRQFAPGYSK